MRRPSILERQNRREARHVWLPSCIGAVALTCLAGGLVALWMHSQSAAVPYRAPAAIVVLILAAFQFRLADHARRTRPPTSEFSLHLRLIFWSWLFVGAVLCYLAGLALGPDSSVGYFFVAGLIAGYTALLWLLIEHPAVLYYSSDRLPWRIARGTARTLFAAAALVVAAEGLVRLYATVADDRLPITYVAKSHVLPPGHEIGGRLVNTLGYWDEEFRTDARPGYFRVAVLGDRMILSGTSQTNCLAQLERAVPGLEVYNFGIPDAGPREYAAQLAHEVSRFCPDLVLTFVSIGDDVTQRLPVPGTFDWRGLFLYQLSARSSGVACRLQPVGDPFSLAEVSREAYLRITARRLTVCRTPLDESMHERWRETSGYLEDIANICRRRQIPSALVLVPGEFQVNAELCQSLCRQAGYGPEQLDLDLPQRRLTYFADDHDLPVLDLLPHLRAAAGSPYRRHQLQWNDEGNTVAAQVVIQWLRGRFGAQIASNTQASLGGK